MRRQWSLRTGLPALLAFSLGFGCGDEDEPDDLRSDSTPPAVTITSAATSTTSSYTLTGTATDDVGVVQLVYTLNDAESDVAIPIAATFSAELTLRDGANTIRVRASDAAGNSAFASLTVTANLNTGPVAADQNVTLDEDVPTDVELEATDAQADNLTYNVVDEPEHGTLSGTPPDVTYTPDANYNGDDAFTFQASDGEFDSNVATVDFTIRPVNDAPVTLPPDDVVNTDEDVPIAILLAGDDVEDDVLAFRIEAEPTNGTLDLSALPTVTYTPNAEYSGSDELVFVANDGELDSEPATVSISVAAVNDAPVATPATVETREDTPLAIVLAATDIDTPQESLVFTITSGPDPGLLDTSGLPTVVYTPAADASGPDSFEFEVSDGELRSRATVNITVIEGSIIYVATDGLDTNSGLTPEAPKRSLGSAMAAADVDGNDLITIADGTYCEPGVVIDRSVTIVGAGMDAVTIDGSSTNIDCTPPAERVACDVRANQMEPAPWPLTEVMRVEGPGDAPIVVQISDLTIANGYTEESGGGILNHEDLTLTRVRLEDNCALEGGGLANLRPLLGEEADTAPWAWVDLIDCEVIDNGAIAEGGGLFNGAQMSLHGTTVSGNIANYQGPDGLGGGIATRGRGVDAPEGEDFLEVAADSLVTLNESTLQGGGIWASGSSVSIDASSVDANTAELGGGLWAENASVEIDNAGTVDGNQAYDQGGGLHFTSSSLEMRAASSVSDNLVDSADPVGNPCPPDSEAHPCSYGGIYSSQGGTVVLEDALITGNQAVNWVGGAYFDRHSAVQIVRTEFTDNGALDGAGGLHVNRVDDLSILDTGFRRNKVSLTSSGSGGLRLDWVGLSSVRADIGGDGDETCMFAENQGGHGGGFAVRDSWADFENCLVRDNAARRGGGIILSYANVTLSDTHIEGNDATWIGGGVYSFGCGSFCKVTAFGRPSNTDFTLQNSTVSGNTVVADALADPESLEEDQRGGGIFQMFGDVTILESTIADNTATDQGGGVFFEGDTSEFGDRGSLSITRSTISGNEALDETDPTAPTRGGGIYAGGIGGAITTINSTFSGNQSREHGSAVFVSHTILTGGPAVSATSCTFFGNTSTLDDGSAIAGILPINPATGAQQPVQVTAEATLIAGNAPNNCSSHIRSDGYNAADDDTCGDFLDADPTLVGDLGDNGGPTLTRAIIAGSALIDAGPLEDCNGLTTDQRGEGFNRIVDGDGDGGARCDIGAFEYVP